MTPDIFLKLETIKGESKDKTHTGEIDIESFTFGLQNGGSWSLTTIACSETSNLVLKSSISLIGEGFFYHGSSFRAVN